MTGMSMTSQVRRAILELAAEDWYGLWELESAARDATGEADENRLRFLVREQIAEMIAQGLLDGAIWSESPARAITSQEVAALPLDSEFWLSPMSSSSDEQMRIAATEEGRQAYFRG
jgi:hypothetical protein